MMSEDLKELLNKREKVRAQEKELTRAIIEQRKADSKAKKDALKKPSHDDRRNKDLIIENNRLRQALAAIIKNTNEMTFKNLGNEIGVSEQRARQVYKQSIRVLQCRLSKTPSADSSPHQ